MTECDCHMQALPNYKKEKKKRKKEEDASVVEIMYLVFTRMPGESYRRQLMSLLYCVKLRISSANYLPCLLILPN